MFAINVAAEERGKVRRRELAFYLFIYLNFCLFCFILFIYFLYLFIIYIFIYFMFYFNLFCLFWLFFCLFIYFFGGSSPFIKESAEGFLEERTFEQDLSEGTRESGGYQGKRIPGGEKVLWWESH